jgi:predicted amidophosphoribosyltransferase
MGFLSGFIDLLFPPKCVFCRRVLKQGEAQMCEACKKDLPCFEGAEVSRRGDFFDECVSPLIYEGAVRESLIRFKFNGMTNYAGCYGSILADCIRHNLAGKYDIITWVPLSAKRMKRRGYDQLSACAAAALWSCRTLRSKHSGSRATFRTVEYRRGGEAPGKRKRSLRGQRRRFGRGKASAPYRRYRHYPRDTFRMRESASYGGRGQSRMRRARREQKINFQTEHPVLHKRIFRRIRMFFARDMA